MATKITDISHDQAFDFLMKPEQYCTTELPEYFDFTPVLEYCRDVVNDMAFPTVPDSTSGVNLDILTYLLLDRAIKDAGITAEYQVLRFEKLAAELPTSYVCDHSASVSPDPHQAFGLKKFCVCTISVTRECIRNAHLLCVLPIAALEESTPDDDFFDELTQLEAES